MIFYGYFRSSTAYRCRIAFNLLGLKPEMRSVHLAKGEQKSESYKAINPQQSVPALEIEGAIITQSLAIIEYLNERYNGNLLGNTPMERARIRAFSSAIACDIHPLQNLRVLQYIAAEHGQTDQAQKDTWCQKWIGDGLTACEALAAKYDGGAWTFGDTPSLADICLIPQIFSAYRFHVNLDAMPRLRAIYDHAQAQPAFAQAAPAKQPDAE